jgi:hypothetical protein
VQGGLGDAGLGGDLAEAVALLVQQPGVFDLVIGVGDGSADAAAGGFGDGAGVGGALGGKRMWNTSDKIGSAEFTSGG